eukprot:scaffold26817_cov38-Cyclotella_meneghiniana.AAC.1
MNDAAEKKDTEDRAADEKKPQLIGCQECGEEVKELSTCVCFGSDRGNGGLVLCEVCADDTRKCQMCDRIICFDHCEDFAIFCGYDPIYDLTCDAAICNTDACRKNSGWKHCFCEQVMYCQSCSQEDGKNKFGGPSIPMRCKTCKTLFCSNDKGDCGRECERCMKTLCCVCLGRVDDPRRNRYCPGCEPEDKKRKRGDEYSDSDEGNDWKWERYSDESDRYAKVR